MNLSDRERLRLEKLEELKRENGMSVESARREEQVGPAAAYREQLSKCPAWKIKRK